MAVFLGIDTSNYTTSLALYETDFHRMEMEKQLLPVREGQCGLRQSDAVFLHVRQLGDLAEALFARTGLRPDGIGVSAFPRRREGSYMPCFLVGQTCARLLSASMRLPLHEFSHQEGHVAAALFSSGRLDLLDESFYAFHISGGTTDGMLVRPAHKGMDITPLCTSLDLHAGQVIDRVGVMLGLSFPCGPALEELALACSEKIKVRPALKGRDCCLSGVENQCRALVGQGREPAYVARFCLESVGAAVAAMTEALLREFGPRPILYAGGVMSNTILRASLSARFSGLFAEPPYSCDNAAGIALLAAREERGRL